MYSIYTLVDPRSEEVRYVGITYDLKARFSGHLHTRDPYGNPAKAQWVKELKNQQLVPIMKVVQSGLTETRARHQEMVLIHEMLDSGVPLTNATRRQPFSFTCWTMGDYDAEIVSYRVATLRRNYEYCIVGVVDARKCIYRFLDDHTIYTCDGTAYANCKKLNDRIKAVKQEES